MKPLVFFYHAVAVVASLRCKNNIISSVSHLKIYSSISISFDFYFNVLQIKPNGRHPRSLVYTIITTCSQCIITFFSLKKSRAMTRVKKTSNRWKNNKIETPFPKSEALAKLINLSKITTNNVYTIISITTQHVCFLFLLCILLPINGPR